MVPITATATLSATTHSHHMPGLGALVLLGLVWAVGYLLLCWIWPFTACRRCSGYRLRPGRHVLNHLRSIHRASK